MRKSLLIFMISLTLLCSLAQITMAETSSVSLTVSDRGVAFSLIQRTASSYFSLKIGDISPYQPKTDPTQVFPLLYIAEETQETPETVLAKRKGQGWGNTAKNLGLPANTHGKYMSSKQKKKYSSALVMNDQDFEEFMTFRFLCDYYNTNPEILLYWHSKGLSYDDLFIGLNLAAKINQPVKDILTLRINHQNWQTISTKYHVSYTSLDKPLAPVHKFLSTTRQPEKSLPRMEEKPSLQIDSKPDKSQPSQKEENPSFRDKRHPDKSQSSENIGQPEPNDNDRKPKNKKH